ncbi:proton-conducting transporter transmembrane domain-containing protein [Phenylobacterium montanum]|uniref:Probable inorganic carbon transporter subunit DabB n=1 Tax=Phenylobacterium montanum TaxID=2823693 RepID=A0A975G4X9_9CAUL|nr:proton-conducting transporter membrane subunit [Caulobacter sp. S6]QUD90612.1 hypothetical protein KCG34_12430 [Caulobacter sp. S6]
MTWIPWLAALAPLTYLLISLAPEGAFPIRKASLAAGWLSLVLAGAGLAGALAFGAASTPTFGAAGLGAAVRVDALSALLASLIGFIGLIVVAYSGNYLAGDGGQERFIRQLCLTLGLLQGLVLSGNLMQLVVCWIAASLCVNRLLLFRAERRTAVLAARKRFLVSRLADVSLIGAAALLWHAAGSGDLGPILAAAKQGDVPDWGFAGALLALAAIFSSAQLPFHGWILEVMETPTPVSALLHAGVVNAGGFLVLRFGVVMAAHPGVMLMLTAVGAVSAVFGSLVMLTQTSVKVALAYSTIAQMGFMLLECGLGAFSAALLHILAHAFYKAHAFLSAGGAALADKKSALAARPAPAAAILAVPAVVALAALVMTGLGVGPTQRPGAFVLSAVLLLGLARVWMQRRGRQAIVAAVASSLVVVPAYLAGQAIFARLIGDLGAPIGAPSWISVTAALGVVALMTGLVCMQLRLPGQSASPAWSRAYALVSNGFYLNTIANRWVLRLWPASPSNSTQPGAAT